MDLLVEGDGQGTTVSCPRRRRPGPYAIVSRPTSFICRTYTRDEARLGGRQGSVVVEAGAGVDAQELSAEDLDDEWDYAEDEEELTVDEMQQSVEELLSGPKDSVMMFAGQRTGNSSCASRLQFDLSSSSGFGDPLDVLLAHAFELRKDVGGAGSSTDQFSHGVSSGERHNSDSIRDLLSGPKDSVMMFAARDHQCSHSKFHLDMSGQEDPLDMLARQVHVGKRSDAKVSTQLEDSSSQDLHAQELALRCRNELNVLLSQQQEWASPRRHQLHRELDMILDDAARSEMLDSVTCSEVTDLKEKLAFQEKDLESIRNHVKEVEHAKQEALYARDESNADWEVVALELWGCQQQVQQLEKAMGAAMEEKVASRVRMDEAVHTIASQSERLAAQDIASLEVQRLRGERDALRTLSASELSCLGEALMESLQRVQRAQQLKFEQRMDEQLCAVCLTERKTVVLQPCNHLTMCAGCFDKCSSACPQCRARVQGHLIIYM